MTTLNNTKENNIKVEALKIVHETEWVGNNRHINMDAALASINLFQGSNSGFYKPSCIRIKGVKGFFMVNENGSLHFEARVIKEDNNNYLIEYLTGDGYNRFERKYIELINA